MLKRIAILLVPVTIATACAERKASAAVPTGASIGPDGFATILDVPPAPFVPVPPSGPKPATAEQIAAQKQYDRITSFQASVRPEVHALANHLRQVENGNFVDFHYDNEGEPTAVFQFSATVRRSSGNIRTIPGSSAKRCASPKSS